jgi:hypothetical protein
MFFYSQAPAYFSSSDTELFPAAGATQSDPKSPIALVGYCINTGSNNSGANVTPPPYCLQRLSKGLTWGGEYPAQDGPGGMTFLTFSGSNQYMSPVTCTMLSGTFAAVGSPPDYSGTDEDFELLSNQVFRLEFCFQVKDLSPGSTGTVFSNCPVAVFTDDLPGNANNNSNTSFSSDSQPNNGPQTDPPTGTLQGTNGTKIHVGDRWYNSLDGLAFICTGYTYSSAGVPVGATWAPIGLSDVTAIVVAIAIMDTNSRKTFLISMQPRGTLPFPGPYLSWRRPGRRPSMRNRRPLPRKPVSPRPPPHRSAFISASFTSIITEPESWKNHPASPLAKKPAVRKALPSLSSSPLSSS